MSLRKLQSLSGIVPLTVYALLHTWELTASVDGRDSFAASVLGVGGGAVAIAVESLLIVIPLAFHVGAGVVMWWRDRDTDDPGSHDSRQGRNVQRVTGLVALVFIFTHLGHTWLSKLGGASAGAIYDELRLDLGTPVYLAVYVIGLTCVCYHVGRGLGAFPRTFLFASSESGRRMSRLFGIVVGLGLWLVSINTLGHFTVGQGVFWGAS